ncbi:hypothetical protein [Meridianimarinicoccus aquatilis]|uniref:PEP-CTERM sorting domain-containing protein n=1 Tax=Meridianimarinicoccus aquatilis TaxID=2552766 RepID=A0A4R6B5G2_9RHOB|nr:hypothetical protein [Fluviibacterium aquatile]TDL91378.1 hypothetical protein E2L05_00230 [Fluviibacterium aquatile]
MSATILRLIAAASLAISAGQGIASTLPTLPGYITDVGVSPSYPGDSFNWPAPALAYHWLVDVDGVTSVPTTVIDFTVTNFFPIAQPVTTFQVFGQCTGPDAPWRPDFTLAIDGAPTPWTWVESDVCLYHNLLNFALSPGDTRFTVTLNSPIGAPGQTVDVRFGHILPAIPLPASLLLSLSGLAALCGLRSTVGRSA